MNDAQLPIPKVWTRARRKGMWFFCWGPAAAVAFVAMAILLPPVDGELGFASGIAQLVAVLVVLANVGEVIKVASRRRSAGDRLRGVRLLERNQQAVLIPEAAVSRVLRIATIVVLASWFFGAWLYGNVVADAEGAAGVLWNMHVFLGLVLAIAVLSLIPMHFITRKRQELGIGLSQYGVYRWTWLRCIFYRWEWISEIVPQGSSAARLVISAEDEWRDVRTDPEENWLAEYDGTRRAGRAIGLDGLSCSPAVAYYALCFYLRHPELRDELGDERGIERIRRCDFPDVIEETREGGRVWKFGAA